MPVLHSKNKPHNRAVCLDLVPSSPSSRKAKKKVRDAEIDQADSVACDARRPTMGVSRVITESWPSPTVQTGLGLRQLDR